MSYGNFASNYRSPLSNLGRGAANTKRGISGLFAKFRNNKLVSGTTDFLYSNSLVAKVCFLVLIIMVFMVFMRLGTKLVVWLLSPNKNPYVYRGKKDGEKRIRVSVNPKTKNSVPIFRSVNERDGLEFTWTVWLYIKSPAGDTDKIARRLTRSQWDKMSDKDKDDQEFYKSATRQHIFHKGSSEKGYHYDIGEWKGHNVTDMYFPNSSPGLYLIEGKNTLVIAMNTFNSIIEEIHINDIPLNKWINVGIRVKGLVMDTYINGTIVNRHQFKSVPKQNYGDVFINHGGGFKGDLSDLRYFHYALSGVEIENIVKAGPDLNSYEDGGGYPKYLALRWFFNNGANAYYGN